MADLEVKVTLVREGDAFRATGIELLSKGEGVDQLPSNQLVLAALVRQALTSPEFTVHWPILSQDAGGHSGRAPRMAQALPRGDMDWDQYD